MTGAELLLKTLSDLGIDTIFGFPGGSALPIYDALYNNKKIRHIRTAVSYTHLDVYKRQPQILSGDIYLIGQINHMPGHTCQIS